MGHDSYTDYAVDGGYQFIGDGTHIVRCWASSITRMQNLVGSFNAGREPASNT